MEKKVISRESCKKDLAHLARADLFSELILLGVAAVFCVPCMIGVIFLFKYVPILAIVLILACAAPLALFIYKLIKNIIAVRLIKKDDFSIIKDTVCRLSKGEGRDGRDDAMTRYILQSTEDLFLNKRCLISRLFMTNFTWSYLMIRIKKSNLLIIQRYTIARNLTKYYKVNS